MDEITSFDEPNGEYVYVSIILKPFRVEPVLRAVESFHLRSVHVTQVKGYGRQKGHLELYQGAEYAISFIPKAKVDLVVSRLELEDVLSAVQRAARTGRIGDGKIFTLNIEQLDVF